MADSDENNSNAIVAAMIAVLLQILSEIFA
jgi:hypothetical protein